ncbi:MAG: hypothetical protein GY801_52445 [bacterium]|nr:hypothetical protein [bacterium]
MKTPAKQNNEAKDFIDELASILSPKRVKRAKREAEKEIFQIEKQAENIARGNSVIKRDEKERKWQQLTLAKPNLFGPENTMKTARAKKSQK